MFEEFDLNDVLEMVVFDNEKRTIDSIFEDPDYDRFSIDTVLFENDSE